MHHIKLVRLNIRLVVLLAVAAAVLLAASSFATTTRQASADYTDPTGILCFQLTELAGNPLIGIGLVRIDLDVVPGGNANDITFTSHVYIGVGNPTCQQLQDPVVGSPFPAPDADRSVLAGKWVPATHTLTANVCQADLNFAGIDLGAFSLIDVNFVLDADPAIKAGGTFALNGPYTDDTCTVQDTGFNSFSVTVAGSRFLAGAPLGTANTNHNWDKDGLSDWEELDPAQPASRDPFINFGVGGIAELADEAGTPLAAPDSSGSNTGLIAGIVAAIAAGTVALGGAAWYTKRRSIQ